MAIEIDVIVPEKAVNAPASYARIDNVQIIKKTVRFTICHYVTKDSQVPFSARHYGIDRRNPLLLSDLPEGTDILSRCYLYAKSQPEYSDGIDV